MSSTSYCPRISSSSRRSFWNGALAAASALFALGACGGEEAESPTDATVTVDTAEATDAATDTSIVEDTIGEPPFSGDVRGKVQKGPFINGAEVAVAELNAAMAQTGRAFASTISDDTGVFRVSGVELANSVETVRFHLRAVYDQLGIASRAELAMALAETA